MAYEGVIGLGLPMRMSLRIIGTLIDFLLFVVLNGRVKLVCFEGVAVWGWMISCRILVKDLHFFGVVCLFAAGIAWLIGIVGG